MYLVFPEYTAFFTPHLSSLTYHDASFSFDSWILHAPNATQTPFASIAARVVDWIDMNVHQKQPISIAFFTHIRIQNGPSVGTLHILAASCTRGRENILQNSNL